MSLFPSFYLRRLESPPKLDSNHGITLNKHKKQNKTPLLHQSSADGPIAESCRTQE